MDLKHWNQVAGSNIVKVGIDLSEFYLSVEWDILAVPATRNEEYYPCCNEPYSGKSYNSAIIVNLSLVIILQNYKPCKYSYTVCL